MLNLNKSARLNKSSCKPRFSDFCTTKTCVNILVKQLKGLFDSLTWWYKCSDHFQPVPLWCICSILFYSQVQRATVQVGKVHTDKRLKLLFQEKQESRSHLPVQVGLFMQYVSDSVPLGLGLESFSSVTLIVTRPRPWDWPSSLVAKSSISYSDLNDLG